MPQGNKLTISYRPHTLCKHSVRVTPNLKIEGDIKLPDLYITHDVLEKIGVRTFKDFLVDVTFAYPAE